MKKRLKRKYQYGGYGDIEYPQGYFQNAPTPNVNTIQGTNQYSEGQYATANKNYGGIGNTIGSLAGTAGGVISAMSENKSGKVNIAGKVGGGILSGAGTGFTAGSAFGPIGMAIGAAGGAIIGGITSGIQGTRRNIEFAKEKKAEKEREAELNEAYSKSALNIYPTSGVKSAQYYYAMGGIKNKYCMGGKRKLALGGQVPGGQVQPIASNVAVAQGATHEQGGMDVQPGMEVEGGEVLAETPNTIDVYSDRLEVSKGMTFAAKAAEYGAKKARYESQLDSPSMYVKNTAKREVQKMDLALQELLARQEEMKASLGIENPQGEAGLGDSLAKILPYADNIANAFLTGATPNIPKPEYNVATPMKTEININPELAESKQQVNQLTRNLGANVSNSSTLRNNVIAANTVNTANMNKLYGQKENIETQLKNQDSLNRQSVINANKALENQYNMNKFNRVDDIHEKISANVANMAEDASKQKAEANLERRDLLELELIKAQFKESGVYDRNMQALFDEYERGDMSIENLINRIREAQQNKTPKIRASKKGFSPKGFDEFGQPILGKAVSGQYGYYEG